MPRGKKRQTTSGQPAQSADPIPGGDYGQGVAQEQIAETMPAVDARHTTDVQLQASGRPSPTASGTPAQMGADPAMLLGSAPAGLLRQTLDPSEPVTAGLSLGPGAGPEALRNLNPRTPMRRTLERLAESTGDPTFRRIIERARL